MWKSEHRNQRKKISEGHHRFQLIIGFWSDSESHWWGKSVYLLCGCSGNYKTSASLLNVTELFNDRGVLSTDRKGGVLTGRTHGCPALYNGRPSNIQKRPLKLQHSTLNNQNNEGCVLKLSSHNSAVAIEWGYPIAYDLDRRKRLALRFTETSRWLITWSVPTSLILVTHVHHCTYKYRLPELNHVSLKNEMNIAWPQKNWFVFIK